MLTELSTQIHKNNVAKGFYDEPVLTGVSIALIHSEASEALEADRHGKHANIAAADYVNGLSNDDEFQDLFVKTIKDSFEDELADVVIRVLDLAGYMGIDIDAHVNAKLRYNSLRPHKHGKKY